MSDPTAAVLVVGAGALGHRIARAHAGAAIHAGGSSRVSAWTFSAASAWRLNAEGFRAAACDLRPGGGDLPPIPPGCRTVYFCAAPHLSAEAHRLYVGGYARVLAALARTLPGGDGEGGAPAVPRASTGPTGPAAAVGPLRLVLAASTGVIGDHAGASVDESVPRDTASPRGRVLAEAEDQIAGFTRDHAAAGVSAVIVRLVGLYGPERNPLAQLWAGAYRYPGDPDRRINLLHLTDAADALVAAGRLDLPAGAVELIHAADSAYPTRREYIEAVCAAYDLPTPPIPMGVAPAPDRPAAPAAGPALGGRMVGDRRIANDKLRRLLLPNLAFPSYWEGLGTF